jgi:hypothetical protein
MSELKLFRNPDFIIGLAIIIFGLVLGACIGFWWLTTLKGSGIMAMVMMISLFSGGYILNHNVDEAEVRRAFAIPVMAVFFWLIAFGGEVEKVSDGLVSSAILEKYWLVALIVLGFYFGGRSFEKIVENLKKNKTKASDNK